VGADMSEKPTIVIAEDHTILREGLRSLLSMEGRYDIVAEAKDGLEAIRCATSYEPDLMLLDLAMPKMNGIAAIKEIKRHTTNTRVLALTIHKSEEYILEAFQSGVDGYCLKDSTHEELLMAIRSVLDGKTYLSPSISERVLSGYLEGKQTIKTDTAWNTLTQREKEILKLIGEGYKNKEISDYLCISVKTVEKHRANLMKKLDLHNVSALTAYSIEKGLVSK
jgi:DNA-binding NarL/FixJ family response regulator